MFKDDLEQKHDPGRAGAVRGCCIEWGLHVAEDWDFAVGFLSVFAWVEAAEFLTFGNAEAHGLLDAKSLPFQGQYQ